MIIIQKGKDCRVTLYRETRIVKNCQAMKLRNSLYDVPYLSLKNKYTMKEITEFGFELKFRFNFKDNEVSE